MGDANNGKDLLPDFCNQTNADDVADSSKEDDSYLVNGELHSKAAKQELQVASKAETLLRDNDVDPGPKLRHQRTYLFRAKEVSSSIMTSERSRIISSISIALVVVLSFIDRPLLGVNIVNSKSIVAMKPLYLLLVTEFTIIIAHLIIERRRRVEDSEENPKVLNAGGLSWEKAVRVLERGLVAHQMIRALFIDFSVYVVIVVCVLSLV
ncbi:hypothetical protein KSS87_011833 [Heliosperma pusillum]|nr:hypothetical protein KSS87_011833 [Heliosperma pusillum]